MDHSKLPPYRSTALEKLPNRLITDWPAGTFLENIALDNNGAIFVSNYPDGIVYKVLQGISTEFCRLPGTIAGLAFDEQDNLFVTGGKIGEPPGVIYKVDKNGKFENWVEIADAIFLNGITPLNKSIFLTVDSLKGVIYAVDVRQRKAEIWLTDERFAPDPSLQGFPGINGIKRYRDQLYVSNTGFGEIYKVQIKTGDRAGNVDSYASELCCDDLALDIHGSLYLTTHMHNTLVRLERNGRRSTVAGPAEGMVGNTACAFGRSVNDREVLYVVSEGGMAVPFEGGVQRAKLVAIEVGETGENLL